VLGHPLHDRHAICGSCVRCCSVRARRIRDLRVFPLGPVGTDPSHSSRLRLRGCPGGGSRSGACCGLIDKPSGIATQALWGGARLFDTARMVGHTAFLLGAVAGWRRGCCVTAGVTLAYAIPTHLVLDILTDKGMGGGWGVWKSWLFWPFEIPRIGILDVASPVTSSRWSCKAGCTSRAR